LAHGFKNAKDHYGGQRCDDHSGGDAKGLDGEAEVLGREFTLCLAALLFFALALRLRLSSGAVSGFSATKEGQLSSSRSVSSCSIFFTSVSPRRHSKITPSAAANNMTTARPHPALQHLPRENALRHSERSSAREDRSNNRETFQGGDDHPPKTITRTSDP